MSLIRKAIREATAPRPPDDPGGLRKYGLALLEHGFSRDEVKYRLLAERQRRERIPDQISLEQQQRERAAELRLRVMEDRETELDRIGREIGFADNPPLGEEDEWTDVVELARRYQEIHETPARDTGPTYLPDGSVDLTAKSHHGWIEPQGGPLQ